MCRMCDGLIKAIDRYLEKADKNLADELADEGRAIPKDSISMVNELEDGIAAALTAQTEYFIKKIKAQTSVESLMKVFEEIKANDVYCDEIATVANEALKKYIPKMVVSYTKTVDAGIKITAVSKRTTAWVESWSRELADLMKLNSHTEIENILKTALENGDSIAAVTRTIMDSGIRDERYKARRAALTEMFRAQNVSKYEAALQTPCVVGRKWRHLGIGNPRPNHVDMDGQTVAKDEPFTLIGADGSVYYPYYPIDPLLPAGEAINCHCVADNVIDNDILGLSIEERQQMRDEAIAQLDEEWEKEVDAKYRALVELTTDEEQYIIKWDEGLHPRNENGKFTSAGSNSDNTSAGKTTVKVPKSQKISDKEYKRLCSQIATDFPNLKADGTVHNYENRNHFYMFSVQEFGKYTFSLKISIDGNEDTIDKIKAGEISMSTNKNNAELTEKQKKLLKLLHPYREEDTSKDRENGVIIVMLIAREYHVEDEMIKILEDNKDKSFNEIEKIMMSQAWFPPPPEIVQDDEDEDE